MKRETVAIDANQASAFVASNQSYPVKITISDDVKKRSLPANAQYYLWLPQIAKEHGTDYEYIRKWMKHDLAWPILERGACDYSIKMRWMLIKAGYEHLDYKQKINMVDMFGVTRFMKSKQHTELRDELQIFWAKNGIQLNYKNEV